MKGQLCSLQTECQVVPPTFLPASGADCGHLGTAGQSGATGGKGQALQGPQKSQRSMVLFTTCVQSLGGAVNSRWPPSVPQEAATLLAPTSKRCCPREGKLRHTRSLADEGERDATLPHTLSLLGSITTLVPRPPKVIFR